MRILHITKYYPPVKGGIEAVACTVVSGLNRKGIITDVLCSHTEAKTIVGYGQFGERITRVASLGRLMSTSIAPKMIFELWKLRAAYDLIHAQMPDPFCCIALLLVRPRVPIIIHWQSDIVKQKWAMLVYSWFQNWLLKRSDAIIATTKSYADSSRALANYMEKVCVIPIGIDEPLKKDFSSVNKFRDFVGGRKLVFCLGRMTYYKGFNVLVDCVKYIDDNCSIIVAGGGEMLEKYREAVRCYGIERKILFVGEIDQDTAQFLFERCDMFCLPSIVRSEAFGVVILEAMAASKAVVATEIDGSGVPWVNVHGETGINVPVNDPRALAKAINSLSQQVDLCTKMGRAARRRYEDMFTSSKMIESILKLYHTQLRKPDDSRCTTFDSGAHLNQSKSPNQFLTGLSSSKCKICDNRVEIFERFYFNRSCGRAEVRLESGGGALVYNRCTNCGFIFTNFFDGFQSTDWTKYLYNDFYYSKVDPDYEIRRPKLNAMAVDSILCYDRQSWIGLDYGGGNGAAAKELTRLGYRYDTYDPYDKNGTQPKNLRKYNFCSVFEVFEHVCDPHATMEEIANMCDENRVAILVGTHVNDRHSNSSSGVNWWYYAPRNGHISIHSSRSLHLLAARYGFNCISLTEQTHLMTKGYSKFEAFKLLFVGKIRNRYRLVRLKSLVAMPLATIKD